MWVFPGKRQGPGNLCLRCGGAGLDITSLHFTAEGEDVSERRPVRKTKIIYRLIDAGTDSLFLRREEVWEMKLEVWLHDMSRQILSLTEAFHPSISESAPGIPPASSSSMF